MKISSTIILIYAAIVVTGCTTPIKTRESIVPSPVNAASVQGNKKQVRGRYAVILPDGKEIIYGNIYGDFDRTPVPKSQTAARYPDALYDKKVTGSAVVTFTLTAGGDLKDITVEANQREFGVAALAAAKRNKYRPAKRGSRAVDCQIELIYSFPGLFAIERIDTRPDSLRFVVYDK